MGLLSLSEVTQNSPLGHAPVLSVLSLTAEFPAFYQLCRMHVLLKPCILKPVGHAIPEVPRWTDGQLLTAAHVLEPLLCSFSFPSLYTWLFFFFNKVLLLETHHFASSF